MHYSTENYARTMHFCGDNMEIIENVPLFRTQVLSGAAIARGASVETVADDLTDYVQQTVTDAQLQHLQARAAVRGWTLYTRPVDDGHYIYRLHAPAIN